MAIDDLPSLVQALRETTLLSPAQIEQVVKPSHGRFVDARELARELVQRDWLTAYQANQLLQGRGRELLLGPYQLLERLGQGGMGQVFKARHVTMDRIVAIKVIQKDRLASPRAIERFQREVRAVSRLSHPNIVQAYDAAEVDGKHFLGMEYVEGIDLGTLVADKGPLPIAEACDYIRQAALGLQHAHERGIVHRDIKPANLLLAAKPVPAVVKILDFGLARFESESGQAGRLTQVGKIVGTVDYMSPEQAENPRDADIRADIYSLGCTLFYLLTGEPPFSGQDMLERLSARLLGEAPSVRTLRPEVPAELDRILAKMLAHYPLGRYQTPAEVVAALQTLDTKEQRQPAELPKTVPAVIQKATPREHPAAAPPRAVESLSHSHARVTDPAHVARRVALVVTGVCAALVVVLVIAAVVLLKDRGSHIRPVAAVTQDRGSTPRLPEERPLLRATKPEAAPPIEPEARPARKPPAKPPPVPEPMPQPREVPQAEPKRVAVTYLSDLPEMAISIRGGDFRKKGLGSLAGTKLELIKVQGKPSPHGILLHPPHFGRSRVRYQLDKQFDTFKASVAINDNANAGSVSPVVFKVAGDGNDLWVSRPVQKCGETQVFEIPVRGVDLLELDVTASGPANWGWAVWIEPQLVGTTSDEVGKSAPEQLKRGLLAELFQGTYFGRKVKTRIDYQINFDWGTSSPDSSLKPDDFTIRWSGWLAAPKAGRYTLTTDADDCLRLWLDGKLLIDQISTGVLGKRSTAISLSERPHRIHVDFVETVGPARVVLSWSREGELPEIVPASAFLHDPSQFRDDRRRAPEAAAVAKAEKEVREIHKVDYGKRSPVERRALAAKLLQHGKETTQPTAQFVLLREARELASQAADHVLAFRAVDAVAQEFIVDALELKAAVLETGYDVARTPAVHGAMAETAVDLMEEAVVVDRYDLALRVAATAENAAIKSQNLALLGLIRSRVSDVKAVQGQFQRVKPTLDSLLKKPDDPQANLITGKFLCFAKGNWDDGLPLLILGSDSKLKELVRKDYGKPTPPQEQVEVGDGWWDLADATENSATTHLRMRAYHCYRQARPKLSGLTRARVDDRMLKRSPKVYLTDMDEFDVKMGPWRFGKHGDLGNPEKSPITVGGVLSLNGLGMHPPDRGFCSVKYRLAKSAQLFRASAALCDAGYPARSPVTFLLVGDDKVLWTSRPMQGSADVQECTVAVTGVDVLELRVVCPGERIGAHAVWVEPHILR